ncbi:NADP-dependent isocitrate dehydrogenase [Desulfovibrio sp. OttesenSCG-928-G15]|nr:NADP-dependent isocitrate dehydrogenase [Desulfovibrio sp. OttesenSCG-928-G15]
MQHIVYYIEGDGIGPEVWQATRPVLEAAVSASGEKGRALVWQELLAGEKALAETGTLLPEETLAALKGASLAIKGPLSTPVGKGFRSLNVTLRQTLDLYACIRPVRHFPGVVSPLKRPEDVDMVIFRENTEDLYMGIEYQSGSKEAEKLLSFLRDSMGIKISPEAGIGLKPMTEKGSKRLVRKAIEYARDRGRPSVTLMHKGNIMKFTEGAFRGWGYEVAREEYADVCSFEDAPKPGTVLVKDRIADALFQEVLLHPKDYSVIATPNLNGDYISDALAAQVGGLGMAPGLNMSDSLAFFEATHGTAPNIAGKDKANPCSLILSGAMMLEHMGLGDAAERIHRALHTLLEAKTVTGDLAAQMEGGKEVGCRRFAELMVEEIVR